MHNERVDVASQKSSSYKEQLTLATVLFPQRGQIRVLRTFPRKLFVESVLIVSEGE
jgi:hypothetical protein